MELNVSNSHMDYVVDGEVLATVSFRPCGDATTELYHTFVDDRLRGQGVAAKLMEAAAREMRRRGTQVLPTCPYAAKWFAVHEEYSDLTGERSPE